MIDTAILLVGLMCVALTSVICSLAYGNLAVLGSMGHTLRAALPSALGVHSLVLAMATLCAIASSVISNQYESLDLSAEQSSPVTLASN